MYNLINLVPDGSKAIINIESLMIKSSHKKALENIIVNDTIGIKSLLWSETIYQKLNQSNKIGF